MRRSPHGERGLKSDIPERHPIFGGSLSSWRAWIEICLSRMWIIRPASRSPHGERGLKSKVPLPLSRTTSRSPHGERGLKFMFWGAVLCEHGRSPHGERGLKWTRKPKYRNEHRSLSSWRAWIEMLEDLFMGMWGRSLSSWRAWIEIGSVT